MARQDTEFPERVEVGNGYTWRRRDNGGSFSDYRMALPEYRCATITVLRGSIHFENSIGEEKYEETVLMRYQDGLPVFCRSVNKQIANQTPEIDKRAELLKKLPAQFQGLIEPFYLELRTRN